MRLSEKETIKMCELYRQNELLWNVYNPHHKKKHVRQDTWEAIAREMNIENLTGPEVKIKIKSIRSTHRQELKKIMRFNKNGEENFRTNLKWFPIIDDIYKKERWHQLQLDKNNSSVENGENKPESILLDDSQWGQQLGSNVEISSESVLSAPSIPSESEIQQSIRSISDSEVIPVTPEIQYFTNSDDYSITSVQSVQPATHSQVTGSPEILTIRAATSTENTPVTSETKTVKSVSTSGIQPTIKYVSGCAVTSTPSGIHTVNSASTPKIFAVIPDLQTSKSVSIPRFVTVSAGNNQNIKYVSNSPGYTLTPETQQRVKQVSGDESPNHRKRHLEEVSPINSNTDVHQNNNSRTVNDFSDRGEDEMDAFGHFVAMNLRKMSMQSSLSAQSEILSILTRHRLNDSAIKPPSNQMFPCIVTNGNSLTQNPVVHQKLILQK